jgi:hypothetical protein
MPCWNNIISHSRGSWLVNKMAPSTSCLLSSGAPFGGHASPAHADRGIGRSSRARSSPRLKQRQFGPAPFHRGALILLVVTRTSRKRVALAALPMPDIPMSRVWERRCATILSLRSRSHIHESSAASPPITAACGSHHPSGWLRRLAPFHGLEIAPKEVEYLMWVSLTRRPSTPSQSRSHRSLTWPLPTTAMDAPHQAALGHLNGIGSA